MSERSQPYEWLVERLNSELTNKVAYEASYLEGSHRIGYSTGNGRHHLFVVEYFNDRTSERISLNGLPVDEKEAEVQRMIDKFKSLHAA